MTGTPQNHSLPAHPSLEHLRKMAKQRHALLKAGNGGAQLADAQLQIAREHGFSSWRAMKMQIDTRPSPVSDESPMRISAGRHGAHPRGEAFRNPISLEQSFFLAAALAMGFLQWTSVAILGLVSPGI